jgi:uncharacterized protein (TIRG00374 family)
MAESDSEAGPGAQPTRKGPSRRTQVISAIVTLVVLAIVFLYLFPKLGSYADAWAAVQTMPVWSIVLLTFAVVLNLFVYVWPYTAATPGLRFRPAFVVRQTSFLISNTVPAGGTIGLAVQYAMLGSYRVGPQATTTTIAVTSTWNVMATLVMPMIGALALLFTGELTSQRILVAVVGAIVVVVMAVAIVVILRSERGARWLGHFCDVVIGWCLRVVNRLFHKHLHADVTAAVMSFRGTVIEVLTTRWVVVTVSNLAMQFTCWFVLFAAIRGIQAGDPTVTWAESLAAFSYARVASFIPIPPGGLGTVDAALTKLLESYGATGSQAIAADLVWRAGTFVPQALIGVGTLLYWRATAAKRGPAAQVGS